MNRIMQMNDIGQAKGREIRRKLCVSIAVLFGSIVLSQTCFFIRAKAEENVVVVLDPGHGGTNTGAQYRGLNEKDLTLVVALEMYQELTRYEGITVYMTRTTDTDLSLNERAAFAKAVGADFLYSIHFNASNNHNIFGSEVWVSGYGEQFTDGFSFGYIAANELGKLGITSRGVKTKISPKGTDYYGIIRECQKYAISSAIIEQCHIDDLQNKDLQFFQSPESLATLGKADATAVAKYYGLKSTSLGVDYSDYQKLFVAMPAGAVLQDTTAPEICQIAAVNTNLLAGTATIRVTASDTQSAIIYCDYSCDGGKTYSKLMSFAASPTGDIKITFPAGSNSHDVVVRVYNCYDIPAESNHLILK